MNPFQGTLGSQIEIVGVGLHSGRHINLSIFPAQPNSGIYFKRTDVANSPMIKATPQNIVSTTLCTVIGHGNVQVSTIEHLMAAFYGLGVDNAIVEVNAEEIPILDGSAAPFVDRILDVGIQRQPVKRNIIEFERLIEVRNEDQFMKFEPYISKNKNYLEVHCIIDFEKSKAIGCQALSLRVSTESFMKLCEARTFCHIDDVNYMRSNGLALGGSLDNAIVVNNDKVINNDGLRYSDEFVRHKLLDCLGDISLLNGHLRGKITTYKAGHSLHAQFTKKVDNMLKVVQQDCAEVASDLTVQSVL